MSLSDDDVEFATRFPALAARMAGLVDGCASPIGQLADVSNQLTSSRDRANGAMSRLGVAEAKLAEARRLLFEAQMVMRRWGNLCHLEYESLDARIDAWATRKTPC